MAFTKCCVVVLALFCGIVSANWGPTDLEVGIGDSKGDLVDLKVEWEAGECPIASYHLYLEKPHENRTEVAVTSDLEYTIEDQEYWTEYNVTLETYFCLSFQTLSAKISTGPGNPHPVKNVYTAPSVTAVNITLVEANMPRIVDQYRATYCTPKDCKTKVFARNSVEATTTMNVSLTDLQPATKYNLSIVPEIAFETKVFRGKAYVSKFTTETPELPVPTNFASVFWHDDKKTLAANLTWKIDQRLYQAAYYNVSVSSDADPASVTSQVVHDLNAVFTGMAFESKFTAQVTPFFKFSDGVIHQTPGIYHFSTPAEPVAPTNFKVVGLSNKEIFAQWDYPKSQPPTNFNFTYGVAKGEKQTIPVDYKAQVILHNLIPATTYDVVITAIMDGLSAQLVTNFTTLATDYSAPLDVKVTQTTQDSTTVSFNLTWTSNSSPKKASGFIIQSCDSSTKVCRVNTTSDETQIVLPFGYFGSYNLQLSAVYKLDLNQTAVRNSTTTLQTPGIAPVAVTKITTQNVTATDVVLVWEAPANVPKDISKNYQISDPENGITRQSLTENIKLEKLQPYYQYNISIVTEVIYQKQPFEGNETFYQFFTDAAAPEAVQSVDVKQLLHTNMFEVVWTQPKVAHGKLDSYEVVTWDPKGKLILNKTLEATMNVYFALPDARDDAKYTVSVRAVNVNRNHQPLKGPFVNSTLFFKGIAAPSAEVIGRASNSLVFNLTWPEKPNDLFFTLTNSKGNKFSDSSSLIEVKNLSPYTNETVQIVACFSPTFCSKPFSVTALTNVAGPTAVTSLVAHLDNRTSPYFNWSMPKTFNGPLDGYHVVLKDLTNSSLTITKLLPRNETSFVYATKEEYETYELTVSAFNNDTETHVPVLGVAVDASVDSQGFSIAKPRNFHQVDETSTSAIVAWEVPNDTEHKITCFHIEVANLYQNFTKVANFTATGLKPYTNTTVLARSCSAEDIKACGGARTFEIETRVDAPSKPNNVAVSDIAETSAQVHWKLPEVWNGPIDGFKIALSDSENQNLTWTLLERGELSFNAVNLTSQVNYTVHVVAFNIDEDLDEELESEYAVTNFSTAGPSGNYTVWIVAGLAVVVIAAVVAGIVIYKRRRAYSEDREQLVHA